MNLEHQKNLKNIEWIDRATRAIESAMNEVDYMLREGMENKDHAIRTVRVRMQLRTLLDLCTMKYNDSAKETSTPPTEN